MVVVACRRCDQGLAKDLAAEAGARPSAVAAVRLDLSDSASVIAAVQLLADAGPAFDIMVLNAAVLETEVTFEATGGRFNRMFTVNYLHQTLLLRELNRWSLFPSPVTGVFFLNDHCRGATLS